MIMHKIMSEEMVTLVLGAEVLNGVIRDCMLELARERLHPEGGAASERTPTMKELEQASNERVCLVAFGSTTATVSISVRAIKYQGRMLSCGLSDEQERGIMAKRINNWIEDIQYGDEPHPWR